MLTRVRAGLRRLSKCCAVGVAALLVGAVGAPGALAAPAAPTGQPSFGTSATAQLIEDTVNAWGISQGKGVTVAVLSSGVDPNTQGLQGKVAVGHDYIPLPYPVSTDGTLLASAIAGSGPTGSNAFGTIGRAPQANILSIRVWPDSNVPGGKAYSNNYDWEDVDASAITEAANSGAQVIVVDNVGDYSSHAMETAVQYAISKNDVVICDENGFASDPNALLYPCALPGVIGAAAVNLAGVPSASPEVSSPANETILVAAPANQVFVSGPEGPDYDVQNDYSATAWLAGTVALIKSVYPNLTPALVARAIAGSARDHPAGGYNTTVGFGLINPVGALQEASTLAKLSDSATAGLGVASPSARLASGPVPGVIGAVHHATAKLAGYGGAIVVGLACLIAALLLGLRWRRPAPAVALAGPLPPGTALGQVPFFPPTGQIPSFPGAPVPAGTVPESTVSESTVSESTGPPVPPGPEQESPPPQPSATDGVPPSA